MGTYDNKEWVIIWIQKFKLMILDRKIILRGFEEMIFQSRCLLKSEIILKSWDPFAKQ